MKNRINTLKTIEINIKWIILFIALFSFIVIVRFLLKSELNYFDDFVYNLIKEYINPKTTEYVKVITKLGNALTVIIICMIIFICQKKYGFFIMLNVFLTAIINIVLKNIFIRQRPSILPLIEENSYSFPSGHSMISIALYGYLFYLAYKKIKNRNLKIVVCSILLIIVILIGLSRIYLGVHYASDVLAGYLIAVTFLIIFIFATDRFIKY